MKIFSARGRTVEFKKPAVMAIINATPDSFSDGGDVDEDTTLIERIKQIISLEADIIDVGGESTRPGHNSVTVEEETKRVVRVVKQIREINSDILISIDTQKSQVAQAAIDIGADFINDVSSLSDENMADVVLGANCSLVIMRNQKLEKDLIKSCNEQVKNLLEKATSYGLEKNKLIIDPGLGFGDLAQDDFMALPGGDVTANFSLVNGLQQYSQELPVLIGASRKRFIGILTGQDDAKRRLAGSLAVAVMAIQRGASILRVHDVAATVKVRDIISDIKED